MIAKQEEASRPQETQEDDVTIADRYKIEATTAISDAYKSGDTSALSDKQKETLDMAKKVLKEIIKDTMTDYEKEQAVYDWMTTSLQNDSGLLTVIPSTTEDCDNPYGVLKYHNAVCVGYATTFRMFMQMMDIDCKVVHNTDNYHSWDLVKLEGDWYHVDIYSDAGNHSYSNFNLSDLMMSQKQDWDKNYFPAAKGIKYNIAYQSMKEIKDIYEIPKMLRKEMEKKKAVVCYSFKSEVTEEHAQLVMQMLNYIDQTLMSLNEPDMPNGFMSYNWMQNEENQKPMLWITMSYNNDAASNLEIDAKDKKKMKKVLDKAFGDLGKQTGIDYSFDNGDQIQEEEASVEEVIGGKES